MGVSSEVAECYCRLVQTIAATVAVVQLAHGIRLSAWEYALLYTMQHGISLVSFGLGVCSWLKLSRARRMALAYRITRWFVETIAQSAVLYKICSDLERQDTDLYAWLVVASAGTPAYGLASTLFYSSLVYLACKAGDGEALVDKETPKAQGVYLSRSPALLPT